MNPVLDRLRRPLQPGDAVFVRHTRQEGVVIGRTANRRKFVDVRLSNGQVVAFYGTSLLLS